MDTLNRLDVYGKRMGYWVVDEDNNATTLDSQSKRKEGRYIKGRKYGAWICYYPDGKTPRLIGEYLDNRPGGAYFRFDKKGKLTQASTVPRKITPSQILEAHNALFDCRMFFHNREMVAGQVFFAKRAFNTPFAYQFWVEESMHQNQSQSAEVNFEWLSQNYPQLYSTYLSVRTPQNVTVENPEIQNVVNKIERIQDSSPVSHTRNSAMNAPFVHTPRVAKGVVFQPNGFNKLYTESDEIWIDGLFRNGQLKDGKVFVYDRDGVLLKVRIFKDGQYVSDGGI
ncbi:hypothetical protein [Fluviicola sp.]|jgi:hypothetical protein|uniref:hypothetical protein n=1 Tax=Fluviicola sp. TaxID=1917219 RepID=UPI0028335E9E|nr:hypothetical protein [Fluviicola sp.]MDR0803192.1 hypothetical protein [Fluviicola sp.]